MFTKIVSAIAGLAAYLRLALFTTRMEWEIYKRIAPHVLGEKDHGYRFTSNEEMWKAGSHENLDILYVIEVIEKQAEHMGKGYGRAFRYIMYRDLNRRMRMYAKLAQWRVPPRLRVAEFA